MSVNKKIAEHLRIKGISQSEFAERLNTNQPNLSRILKADDMKVSQLIEMSKLLNVSPAYFIDGVEIVGNEELEMLKQENKTLKNYSNLISEHIKTLIDAFYNTKIEILKTEFLNEDSKVKDQLIEESEGKREEEKHTYTDLNTVFLELAKKEYNVDRSEMIKECRSEIRKASRTTSQTETLKARAQSINQRKNKN
jgi:transcriptional regulator with XRE-family HTH domain